MPDLFQRTSLGGQDSRGDQGELVEIEPWIRTSYRLREESDDHDRSYCGYVDQDKERI